MDERWQSQDQRLQHIFRISTELRDLTRYLSQLEQELVSELICMRIGNRSIQQGEPSLIQKEELQL